MSGIGGYYELRAGCAHSNLIPHLRRGLAHLGSDRAAEDFLGPSGFVAIPFHTTSEARLDEQPYRAGAALIAFDGRLDNRDELSRIFGVDIKTRVSDVALVADAFQKWGSDCFAHLLGDYAVAIFDAGRSSLLLARDPCGARPLYYHLTDERVIWASDTRAILGLPGVSWNIDETYVATYLALDVDHTRSPFTDIRPVLPGHLHVFRAAGAAPPSCFWNVTSRLKTIRYRSDSEYAEHFRQLFLDAVQARLRSDSPVMAQLSGGLDSSSVVCAADVLKASGKVQSAVVTSSFVFDAAEHDDERSFIREVERKRGIAGIHLHEDRQPILSFWPDPDFISFPSPIFCFGGRLHQLTSALQSISGRVLLSGWGGDHLMMSGYYPLQLADSLVRGRLVRLGHEVFQWAAIRKESVASVFWRSAADPGLVRRVYPHKYARSLLPHWISERFARRSNLIEALISITAPSPEVKSPSLAARLTLARNAIACVADEYPNYKSGLGPIEVRYPFLDTRLIEYVLSIPTEQIASTRGTRYVQRMAMRGFLPDKVLFRIDKRGPDEATVMALNRSWNFVLELVDNSRAAEAGYVDAARLKLEFQRARHGVMRRGQTLMRFISLEMWLRALERASSSPPADDREARTRDAQIAFEANV
jgi:asparagine synthase (glutamine-hydrolysing)